MAAPTSPAAMTSIRNAARRTNTTRGTPPQVSHRLATQIHSVLAPNAITAATASP
jgi:hypothetical protein